MVYIFFYTNGGRFGSVSVNDCSDTDSFIVRMPTFIHYRFLFHLFFLSARSEINETTPVNSSTSISIVYTPVSAKKPKLGDDQGVSTPAIGASSTYYEKNVRI